MRLSPSRLVLPWSVLLAKEWAGLRAGRAFWVLLLVQALLAGAGYTQAVALYAEASRAALEAPDLAAGLSPLEGVAVPTFGSLYLGLTLLWPFVVIRLIGRERAEGTLALLLQTRVPLAAWLTAKLAVLGAGVLLLLLISGSALTLWLFVGGHLGVGETLALILGYALYAVLVTGVAALAAALMDSAASAAILTLPVTLGAWALDFAAAGDRGWLHALGALSPTVMLRQFENGLVTFADTAGLLVAGLAALVLAGLWLAPGARRGKLAGTAGVVAVGTPLNLHPRSGVTHHEAVHETVFAAPGRPGSPALAGLRAIPGRGATERAGRQGAARARISAQERPLPTAESRR